ncbi:MAG: GAF domain-containing protein [Anaerolineales bacterium]|nr:GAF domain-containing protein [Anaerolineales bacterium]
MSEQERNALPLNELQAIYAISRVITETLDVDEALSEIVRLARPVFIFDNAVLYLASAKGELEPAFARAIGRGRSSEADSAWGEAAAQVAFHEVRTVATQPEPNPQADRLQQRFFLALPLLAGGSASGALVFVRFGGPEFTKAQINLAQYIAAHVTQVLEHKRLVERIASLEAERRLSQLQSDFIAMVSHELKTPLGFIKGYSTTLLRPDASWTREDQLEFLTIIDEEADRLVELVDNLLDSSRLQGGNLELDIRPVELASVIDENVERMRVRYPALQVLWEPPQDNSLVEADARRLGQVLENLASNAAKYAGGGQLAIELGMEPEQATLSVRDQGPGVPEAESEQVFERFYRVPSTKELARGSGLGLYICKQIILAHGGRIFLGKSKEGGAEFVIQLPRMSGALRVVRKEEKNG